MEIPVLFVNLTNVKFMCSDNKHYDLCGQMWLNNIKLLIFIKKRGGQMQYAASEPETIEAA